MQTIDHCPSCASKEVTKLRDYVFRFPGGDIQAHLSDLTYERLWILFERILKDRREVSFQSVLCRHCGLIFTNPRFAPEEFRIKYATIVELGGVKRRQQAHPPSNLEARANRVYGLIHRHLTPGPRKPAVLDYGGASGYILAPFAATCDCGVLDYEKWTLPDGVAYLGKDISNLEKGVKFDVILLLHTLEHVLEPKVLLESLCQALKPDGILYVEVPLGCFREWNGLREPLTHINFFSEQSLAHCLQSCGLFLIHLSTTYQWVTHGKLWCLNIIGCKQPRPEFPAPKPLSTARQMRKLSYYLPLLTTASIRKVRHRFLRQGR